MLLNKTLKKSTERVNNVRVSLKNKILEFRLLRCISQTLDYSGQGSTLVSRGMLLNKTLKKSTERVNNVRVSLKNKILEFRLLRCISQTLDYSGQGSTLV